MTISEAWHYENVRPKGGDYGTADILVIRENEPNRVHLATYWTNGSDRVRIQDIDDPFTFKWEESKIAMWAYVIDIMP